MPGKRQTEVTYSAKQVEDAFVRCWSRQVQRLLHHSPIDFRINLNKVERTELEGQVVIRQTIMKCCLLLALRK